MRERKVDVSSSASSRSSSLLSFFSQNDSAPVPERKVNVSLPVSSRSSLPSSSSQNESPPVPEQKVPVPPPSAWTCGNDWVDDRGDARYATTRVGTQCWMAEQMNIGVMISSGENQGTSCASVQKYCYQNSEEQCAIYGGLYQWSQAMCDSVAPGARGICPAGWHIPTHDEWTTLERSVCDSATCGTDFPYDAVTTGWRGTDESVRLKPGGTSGFNGALGGYRDLRGAFGYLGMYGNFWASSQSGANAWFRDLASAKDTIGRNVENPLLGFSVRCLKN